MLARQNIDRGTIALLLSGEVEQFANLVERTAEVAGAANEAQLSERLGIIGAIVARSPIRRGQQADPRGPTA